MARQPRLIEDTPAPAEPVTETITYVPADGDKPTAVWCGHTFKANVPKEITGHAEGSAAEKLNHHLIESVRRGNPCFKIGNGAIKRAASSEPSTSAEYIRHFLEWLKDPEIEHAAQLIKCFADDRELREACEVGTDDYQYISTLLMPRLHDLAKGDELNETGLARIWIEHGFNQLPW